MPDNSDLPAVVFPGQGIAVEAITESLRSLADEPLTRTLLERFQARTIEELTLTDTRVAQPAIYVCGLLRADAAADAVGLPSLTAGHSLGEVTALVFAGGMTWADGLDLVIARGELFHAAQQRQPGAMLAVMGLPLDDIEWLRRVVLAEHGGTLEVACINSVRQIVLSGDRETIAAAMVAAQHHSALANILPVGAAAHSPLMMSVLDEWRAMLADITVHPLRMAVVSSVDARVHSDPAECLDLLARAFLLPVRWPDAVATLQTLGVSAMWDAGPGEVLANLGRRMRSLPCAERFVAHT